MSRKHFYLLAEALAGVELTEVQQGRINSALRQANPNFDPCRFWGAVQNYTKKMEEQKCW